MAHNKLIGLFSLLKVLVLISCLFGAYALVYLRFDQEVYVVQSFKLPENLSTNIVVDGKNEAIALANEMAFSGNADELISKLKKKLSSDSDSRSYGINWMQPIYYFKTNFKGKELQGMIVSILDHDAWDKDINKLLGNVSAALRVKRSGMVVQSNELSRQELYQFINSHQIKNASLVQDEKVPGLVQFNSHVDHFKSKIDVICENNNVLISGNAFFSKMSFESNLNFRLKPASFHLTTDLVVEQVRDSIEHILGAKFPLSGISINYNGMHIKEQDETFAPVPSADIILGFKQAFAIDSLLQFIPAWKWNQVGESIVYGGTVFYLKQLDSQTIYIGQSSAPIIEKLNQQIGLVASGSLKSLLAIEGNSFVRMAVSMNPTYGMLRELSNKCEKLEFKITSNNKSALIIDSKLVFNDGKSATLAVLEMLVNKSL